MFLLSLPSRVLLLFGTFILSPDSSHLEHVPVHINGNGAPQFGEKGFERVPIPSGGREKIHFVPTAVGTFEYRCNLSWHQMIGTIVVEEQPTGRQAVVESGNRTQGRP